MRLHSTCAVIGLVVFTAAPALSAPLLAGYPAPGGTSFSGVGNPFGTGGATWTYSNFDTSAWDQLWWGFEEIEAAMDGAIDTPGESLELLAVAGATAEWRGTTSINAGAVETRLVATIISGGSNWVDAALVGITSPEIDLVSELDGTTDFVVDAIFEARFVGDAAWTAWFPFFDPNTGQSEDGNSRTSFYRNFYYTPVPLPGALPMALAGLSALGLLSFRRRS